MTNDEFYKMHQRGTLPLQEQVLQVLREAQEPLTALIIAGRLCGRRTGRINTALMFDDDVQSKLKEIEPVLTAMVGGKTLLTLRHKPTIGEPETLYAPPPR